MLCVATRLLAIGGNRFFLAWDGWGSIWVAACRVKWVIGGDEKGEAIQILHGCIGMTVSLHRTLGPSPPAVRPDKQKTGVNTCF